MAVEYIRPRFKPALFSRASTAYLDGVEHPVDAPRFLAGGGVMVEEEMTNLEAPPVDDIWAGWNKLSINIINIGAYTARISATAAIAGGNAFVYKSFSYSGTTKAFSVEARGVGGTIGKHIRWRCGAESYFGPQTTLTADWQRIEGVITFTDARNVGLEVVDGLAAGDIIELRFRQIEAKLYATSFHPTSRARESLTLPNSGLSPTGGTLEVKVLINSMARRQVTNQLPELFAIMKADNVNPGIRIRHAWDSANWFLVTYADDGTYTMSSAIPDSVVLDGIRVLRCDWNNETKIVRLYCDTNLTPIATITDAKLPSTFGASIAIGGRSDTTMLNVPFHGVRMSNVPRGAEGLCDASTLLTVDEYTLGLWLFQGSLLGECFGPLTIQAGHPRYRIDVGKPRYEIKAGHPRYHIIVGRG